MASTSTSYTINSTAWIGVIVILRFFRLTSTLLRSTNS